MSVPSIAPTLADLELALERAESRLARAPYIDDFRRMLAEEAAAQREIDNLTARISAAKDYAEVAKFHCHLWPTCGCPDGVVRHDCPALQVKP